MKESVLGALTEYLPVIEKLPQLTRDDLLCGLQELKNLGVMDYGRRLIWRTGYSSMLTTSTTWVDAFNSKQLHKCMIEHMSEEALHVRRNNLSMLTRSSDKLTNEYLKVLDFLGLNNSLVKYHFFRDHIEVVYYVGPSDDPNIRDIFLNKIALLEKTEQRLFAAFVELKSTKRFMEQRDIVINPLIMDTLIGKQTSLKHSTYISKDQGESAFNYKELSYLTLLRFECSNKYLACQLNISESTVKQDIANLKLKLNLESREKLIRFANNPKIVQLTKIIGII